MNVQIAESNANQTTEPDSAALMSARLRRLVLTGFMGAGKSTVGRMLANHLGWDFVDLDALIEARTGLAVPSIFAEHGEPHFRKLESQALAAALGRSNVVLALGGGTPEILTNRLLLEQTPGTATVFLDAPFPTLYDRCMMQALNPTSTTRPNLADPTAAEARFHIRQPIYRRLARYTIDTADLTTEETVASVLARVKLPPQRRR